MVPSGDSNSKYGERPELDSTRMVMLTVSKLVTEKLKASRSPSPMFPFLSTPGAIVPPSGSLAVGPFGPGFLINDKPYKLAYVPSWSRQTMRKVPLLVRRSASIVADG